MNEQATLYVFSGLPGSGKTTLSQELSKEINAVHLRIDTIEQALRDLCSFKVEGEGYHLAYRVASDNLNLGNNVIADSCNPINLTRREWEDVAKSAYSNYVNIEIICSDKNEHRKRIKERKPSIPNLVLPSWKEVEHREYHSWEDDCLVIDTAFKTENESFAELLLKISN